MNDSLRTCSSRYTLFFSFHGLLRWIDFDSKSFIDQLIECNCSRAWYVCIDWVYRKTVREFFPSEKEKLEEYKMLDSIDILHD